MNTKRVYCRSSLAVKLLCNLTGYHITAAGSEAATAEVSSKAAVPRPTKQQVAKARRREAEMGDAEAVTAVPVSARQIESTPFFQYFDIMVRLQK